jgi:hypothetical protein
MFRSFLFFLSSFFRFLICEPASIMFKLLDLEILLSELYFDLHLCCLSGQELSFKICMTLIGSPHCLNSEFAFYTHSKHYLNITTHFWILFCISELILHLHSSLGPPKPISETSDLFRTSEVYFGNFGPISDLRRLFRKLRTSSTCIPTFRPPIRTTSMIYDLVSSSPLFIFSHIYVLNVL